MMHIVTLNVKRKTFYFFCLVILISQIAFGATERINFNHKEIQVDEPERYVLNEALAKAGIEERLTNELPSKAWMGRIYFTPNYAVKLSKGENKWGCIDTESSHLINANKQIQQDQLAGVTLRCPEHIYTLQVGEENWGRGYEGYNIQIMSRIHNYINLKDLVPVGATECINFNDEEIQVDEPERYVLNVALAKAGIEERLTNEPPGNGGMGNIYFTPSYAVKLSKGEYEWGYVDTESSKLINVKNQIQKDPPAGVTFCYPEHIYLLQVGEKNWGGGYEGYNIQIMPRIHDYIILKDLICPCIKDQSVGNMQLMKIFGEKMGQFQNWGLVRKSEGHDLTCMHGDFNASNSVVKIGSNGDAEIIFIDLADYSSPKVTVGGGGSLVTEIIYVFLNKRFINVSNWEEGLFKALESFYKGYIPQFPREVCQKLLTTFYANPEECYEHVKRDYALFTFEK